MQERESQHHGSHDDQRGESDRLLESDAVRRFGKVIHIEILCETSFLAAQTDLDALAGVSGLVPDISTVPLRGVVFWV